MAARGRLRSIGVGNLRPRQALWRATLARWTPLAAEAPSLPSDLRDQLHETLGAGYTLDRELGGGGMSRVFLANETRLNRKVVVKVLSPELAQGISAERFEREIASADGRRIDRDVCYGNVYVQDTSAPDILVFAEPGDFTLLGARALEGLNLRIDVPTKRLVRAGPVPAAAAA